MDFTGFSRRALLSGTPGVFLAAAGASPKDYGAAGDGIADDTTAINQCLAANRFCDFGGPENTYRVTDTLLVQQAVPQVVTGHGATVRAGAAVNLMRLKNARHRVSGLTFEGNGQTAGLGIIVESTASASTVEDCTFLATAASGVHVQIGAHHVKIVGCVFDRCGHGTGVDSPYDSTIFINAADHCTVRDNDLLNCFWGVYFRGNDAATGISFYHCTGNTLTCVSPAPLGTQGISNGYGRHGRICDNAISGFGDNSIDMFGCRDMTITGNNTRGGKDGVFVGDEATSGITISGNSFRGPHRGVRVLSGYAGVLVSGIVITGNTVIQPSDGGILVQESGTAQVTRVTIADNNLDVGGTGSYGVKLLNAEVCRVSGNHILRSRSEGIFVDGADIVELNSNTVQDAGISAPNTIDAIRVGNSSRVLVRDNTVYGSARHAVTLAGGSGQTVSGTRWRSVTPGGVNNGGSGTVLSDNSVF